MAAKGIRVSQLAKELGVNSSAIVERLKSEGLGSHGGKPITVSSTIQIGLAETIKDWFANGAGNGGDAPADDAGGGTSVAVRPAKPKVAKKSTRKTAHPTTSEGDTSGHSGADGQDPSAEHQHEVDATSDQHMGGTDAAGGSDAQTAVSDAEGLASSTEEGQVAEQAADAFESGLDEAQTETIEAESAQDTSPSDNGSAGATKASPSKVVKPVPFTPQPAKGSGPRVVVNAPTPVAPRRFGEKVRQPMSATTPAAKAAVPQTGTKTDAEAGTSQAAKSADAAAAAATAKVAKSTPSAPGTGTAAASAAGQAASVQQAGAANQGGPAAGGAGATGGRPNSFGKDGQLVRPALRETITLNSKQGPQSAPRPATGAPPPKLVVPEPAKMQGPKLVRQEKPDVVPTPRPRRPGGPGGPGGGAPSEMPSFNQARPGVGRGVRIDEDEEEAKKAAAKKGSLSTRRRGVDGRRGEADERLKEFTDADIIARRDALNAAAAARAGIDRHLKQHEPKPQHVQSRTAVERGGVLEIELPISVKSLSAAMGVKSNEILGKLLRKGIFANVNAALSMEQAEEIALDFGLELKVKAEKTTEELLLEKFEAPPADPSVLKPRAPVVTILGHVDHGKTSLLDKIRNANIAAGEAGGITQHTAAWMVTLPGNDAKRVTFIDTPGHQAFTAMRARGANMTDIVVLVVSAAEGVQPQTIESINHARAAEVPIVVALNKIDRADANPDMVLGQLAKEGLNPVEWGGDTEVVRVSALTGKGIPDLLEILTLQAEILELKANPTAPARGIVIESRIDEGLGSVATVLVQDGTLRTGDVILAGEGHGRLRTMLSDTGKVLKEAPASTPVIIAGLSELPSAGERFFVIDDIDTARTISEERVQKKRSMQIANLGRGSADAIVAAMNARQIRTINVIIKGDVHGSVETLVASVTGQNTEEVKVRVIHSGVGAISESDVQLAMATKAKPTDNRVAIIGFNVVPEEPARSLAERNHVELKTYRVIYEIFDDLKKALSGMLSKEVREKLHGHAEVRQVFKVSRLGNVAGCLVIDGHIQRGSKIRLTRSGTIVTQGLAIDSLKRVKDDVREVKQGLECGIKLIGYDDIKVGDIFEAYVTEEFERTL